jgi:hypothetical protein
MAPVALGVESVAVRIEYRGHHGRGIQALPI